MYGQLCKLYLFFFSFFPFLEAGNMYLLGTQQYR